MNCDDRQKTCLPLLREVPLFSALEDDALSFIAGGCHLRTAERGRLLCEKGSRLQGFFLVLGGRVKLAILSEEGAERVVDICLPGRLFAEASAFLDQPCPYFAEALSDSRLLFFDRQRIREAATLWPEVAMAMLGSLARQVHGLTRDLETCCLMSAPRRVSRFLLQEMEHGASTTDEAEIELPAAKVVVASRLNLTAETFSRELHALARSGVIAIDKRRIRILSVDRLRQSCTAA